MQFDFTDLSLGGLPNLLKWAFYIAAGLFIAFLIWKNRKEIFQAVADILRQLREVFAALFGRGRLEATDDTDDQSPAAGARHRPFSEFQDPFTSGWHRKVPPDELVRYTFEAFEAWARDRGCPRSLDQTPYELIRRAVPPEEPMYAEARSMVRLYNEAAYATGTISPESADGLREIWSLMRATYASRMAASAAN